MAFTATLESGTSSALGTSMAVGAGLVPVGSSRSIRLKDSKALMSSVSSSGEGCVCSGLVSGRAGCSSGSSSEGCMGSWLKNKACSSAVGGSQGSRAGTALGSKAVGSSASGRLWMLPVVDSPSRLEAKSSMKLCTT